MAALAIASLSMASAQEKADTLTIENPRKVTVISEGTSQSVSIEGLADDPDYTYYRKVDAGESGNVHEYDGVGMLDFNVPFTKKPKKKRTTATWEAGIFDLYGGFMVHAKPNPYEFENWQSNEAGVSVFRYKSRPISPYFHISSLLGFSLRDFRPVEDMMFRKSDGGLSLVPVPENTDLGLSKVMIFSANIPVFLNFHSRRDKLNFSLGPVVNMNFHSRIKNVYSVNGGKKVKDREKNIHAKAVSVDYMAMLKFSDFGFYARWSPHGIFDTGYSSDAKTVSVGLIMDLSW